MATQSSVKGGAPLQTGLLWDQETSDSSVPNLIWCWVGIVDAEIRDTSSRPVCTVASVFLCRSLRAVQSIRLATTHHAPEQGHQDRGVSHSRTRQLECAVPDLDTHTRADAWCMLAPSGGCSLHLPLRLGRTLPLPSLLGRASTFPLSPLWLGLPFSFVSFGPGLLFGRDLVFPFLSFWVAFPSSPIGDCLETPILKK